MTSQSTTREEARSGYRPVELGGRPEERRSRPVRVEAWRTTQAPGVCGQVRRRSLHQRRSPGGDAAHLSVPRGQRRSKAVLQKGIRLALPPSTRGNDAVEPVLRRPDTHGRSRRRKCHFGSRKGGQRASCVVSSQKRRFRQRRIPCQATPRPRCYVGYPWAVGYDQKLRGGGIVPLLCKHGIRSNPPWLRRRLS